MCIFLFVWYLQLSSCLSCPVQINFSRQILYSIFQIVTHLFFVKCDVAHKVKCKKLDLLVLLTCSVSVSGFRFCAQPRRC